MKIRAAVLNAIGNKGPYAQTKPLTIEEVELKPPGYGEVLIQIGAAGLCHSDLSVINGDRPRPMPMALGHEAAGIVEELGPGVTDLKKGDKVVLVFVPSCGHCAPCAEGRPALCEPGAAANTAGTLLNGDRRIFRGDGSIVNHHLGCSAFATHAVVSRNSVVKVHPDLPLDQAALFGCAVLTGMGAVVNTAGVKPGQTVADFIPGGGYFTRIFSKAVGPKGKVIAITNPPPANAPNPPPILALAADPQYGNIKVVSTGIGSFVLPEQVDVLWTSQNYHDLFARQRGLDITKIDKMLYDAVKPGGVFIVLDHAAAPGTPIDPDDKLHRIDPATVRKQVESAGFKFEGESTLLRNPADDHTKTVFDPSIRGHTDQFIYKFRKPK